jgi:uncharacterized membrane protein (DUF373 family)
MKMNDKLESGVQHLEFASKLIALFVCIGLLMASVVVIFDSFSSLYARNINVAIHDGLFVLILLEMFYVTRSFIKYGSINIGLIISVGLIAAVKEMVFRIDRLDLNLAIAFGVIYISLALAYLVEAIHFSRKQS